jgi:hypothetical protein
MFFISSDSIHFRVVDDFKTQKNWVSQVIDHQHSGPIYNGGFWSDPIKGPTFKAGNGKGYFHFPRLESWSLQGFEYDYLATSTDSKGLKTFEGTNYLAFNIVNKSPETVWMKFRLMDEISYTYNNPNGQTNEESLIELVTEPDTFLVKPNAGPQKIRLKLKKPIIPDPLVLNPDYENCIRFFSFETRRTVRSSEKKPTLDCTLVIDHLQIEDVK